MNQNILAFAVQKNALVQGDSTLDENTGYRAREAKKKWL